MESAMAEVSAEKEPLLGFSEEKLLKILRNMLLYLSLIHISEPTRPY